MGEINLTEIIAKCCNNDIRAQEELYKTFYSYGMSIALRFSSGIENAKEILNDSFLKIFRNIHLYDPEKNFKSWLRRIVINTCIDKYRTENKIFEILTEEQFYPVIKDSSNIIDKMSSKEILNIIQKLPENYRIVFGLYELEGYSHEEIAKELSIAISTSRSILTRAKSKLRHLIEKYNG